MSVDFVRWVPAEAGELADLLAGEDSIGYAILREEWVPPGS